MSNRSCGVAFLVLATSLGTLPVQAFSQTVSFCEAIEPTFLSVIKGAQLLARGDTHYVRSPADHADPGPGAQCAFPLDFELLLDPEYPEIPRYSRPSAYVMWKTPLGSGLTGYALLVPGMYTPTRIDLYVYDTKMHRLGEPIQLADVWGDAGESTRVRSWFVDLNRDGVIDVLRHTCTPYYDVGSDSSVSSMVHDALEQILWSDSAYGTPTRVRDSAVVGQFVRGRQACLPN